MRNLSFVYVILVAGVVGCGPAENVPKESRRWVLQKLTSPGYDGYQMGTGIDSIESPPAGNSLHAVRIVFDNGSSETLSVHLPGNNDLPIANGRFVVLYAQVKDFQFAVSSPTQGRRDYQNPLQPKSPWHTTYVFNFRGLNTYRIEKRTYQLVGLRQPPPDEAYEVAGQEWFEIKLFPGNAVYYNVDFFFQPFPASVVEEGSEPLLAGLTETTRVRIVRK